MTTDISAWGLSPEVMKSITPKQRTLILSLLNRLSEEGRNWERFRWLLQTILPQHFGSPSGGDVGGVAVSASIKFTVEEHKAIKADYAKLSAQADRLLGLTNGDTETHE